MRLRAAVHVLGSINRVLRGGPSCHPPQKSIGIVARPRATCIHVPAYVRMCASARLRTSGHVLMSTNTALSGGPFCHLLQIAIRSARNCCRPLAVALFAHAMPVSAAARVVARRRLPRVPICIGCGVLDEAKLSMFCRFVSCCLYILYILYILFRGI